MNRRSFLKLLPILTGALTLSPSIIKNVNVPTIKKFEKRKLKCIWTVEMEQDLQCYYNIKAEDEITKILTERANIDMEKEMWIKYT